jgi:uncharacterized lipoprotein YddW (UPF0748 family)
MRDDDGSRRAFLRRCAALGLVAAGWPACASPTDDDPTIPAGPEIRAVWLSLFSPRDLFCEDGQHLGVPNAAGVQRVITILADNGINTLYLMVDSWYAFSVTHPEYLPRSPLAEWDALGEIFGVAGQRGITVHVNFTLVNNRNSPRLPGIAPDFLPAAGGDPAWRAAYLDAQGQPVESPDNVCPSRPETRAWETDLCVALLERYPQARHLQFEEPGYDTRRFCVCAECRRQFEERHDRDLVAQVRLEAEREACPGGTCDRLAAQFKSERMTAMLGTVRQRLAHRRLACSATISYDWWLDQQLGRDWRRWTADGWLDFVAPMIYVSTTAEFRQALEDNVLPFVASGRSVVAGIGVHYNGFLRPEPGQPGPRINSVDEVVSQIHEARAVSQRSGGRVAGFALFMGQLLRPIDRERGDACLAGIRAGAFGPAW